MEVIIKPFNERGPADKYIMKKYLDKTLNKISVVSGILLPCIITFMLNACSDPTAENKNGLPEENTAQLFIDQGDLAEIKQRGTLRVLLPRLSADIDFLPRSGLPIHAEVELLTRFTKEHELEPVWIYVDKFEQLMPMLMQGKGDIIAANFTVTEERKKQMAFTVPVATVREQLVTRSEDQIKELADLVGREIAVQQSASYWETAQTIVTKYPGVKIKILAEELTIEKIIDSVANHKLDVAIVDDNFVAPLLPILSEIKTPLNLTEERPVAWAIRLESKQLKTELDNFLNNEQLITKKQQLYKEDLTDLKKRKVLRVLTRNNAATYFLWRGKLMGFEYELAKVFANKHNLRLEMVVAPTRKDLFVWLREGRGDLIAANLTILPEEENLDVKFSRGYNKVREVIVTRQDDDSLKSLTDLNGRTIHIRPSSSYWRRLTELKNKGAKFTLEAVSEDVETEEIIDKVAKGEFDVTIADSHILDVELAWREDEIKAAFELEDEVSHGWVVREDTPELLEAVNQFIKKEYKGLFYNLAKQKYFKKPQLIKKRLAERVDKEFGGSLSPFDDLAKQAADEYGFDWRMVVSQMYQESRFKPDAKSWAGARGLMQIMPRTAKELGIVKLADPEQGIKAGVKYLDWLRNRFEPELAVKDRMWFVLASYNAGAGHVKDARRLARQQKLNPNRWFDNVEKAMLLLSKREYARKAVYGYVRGIEPVKYVREISERYQAYVKLTQARKKE